MSKKSATPQLFRINKSRFLRYFLVISHSFAAVASLSNALFWGYKLLILMAVITSLFLYLRRYDFQFQPYQLRYTKESDWQWARDNNEFQAVEILPSSVVTAWVIVLHFQSADKNQQLVIFKDALADKDYRALVVTLKVVGLGDFL